jgi:hypothetical protein
MRLLVVDAVFSITANFSLHDIQKIEPMNNLKGVEKMSGY